MSLNVQPSVSKSSCNYLTSNRPNSSQSFLRCFSWDIILKFGSNKVFHLVDQLIFCWQYLYLSDSCIYFYGHRLRWSDLVVYVSMVDDLKVFIYTMTVTERVKRELTYIQYLLCAKHNLKHFKHIFKRLIYSMAFLKLTNILCVKKLRLKNIKWGIQDHRANQLVDPEFTFRPMWIFCLYDTVTIY